MQSRARGGSTCLSGTTYKSARVNISLFPSPLLAVFLPFLLNPIFLQFLLLSIAFADTQWPVFFAERQLQNCGSSEIVAVQPFSSSFQP